MQHSLHRIVRILRNIFKMTDEISVNPKRPHDLDDPSPVNAKLAKTGCNAAVGYRSFRKCAIVMIYSGWGYFGMQRNGAFKTIEGDLLSALRNAGYISDDQLANPPLIHFQRASKTDKNVSAAGQVCSAKLPIDTISVDKINAQLPDQIRILDIFRVTKNFHPQTGCNHRVYQYLLPSFAFAPRDAITSGNCWQYRLSAKTVANANEMFQHYKGTHNYYNFTSGRKPNDKSCMRYIMSIECGNPFILADDKEFAMITIQGQSFMLHQIRKMIGLVIAIVSGHTTEAIFDEVFKTERLDIPKAPGLGLLLDHVDYTRYNQRFCTDGSHKPINWEIYKEEVEKFKKTHIFQHMIEREINDNSMLDWISNLGNHSYSPNEEKSPTSSREPSQERILPEDNPTTADGRIQAAEPTAIPIEPATSLNPTS